MKLKYNAGLVFQDSHRYRVLKAGRRFGKSREFVAEILRTATYGNTTSDEYAEIWYIAPTYRAAKRIFWKVLRGSIPWQWVAKINESELSIMLRNGLLISLKGADNPDCYDDETEILTRDGWVKFGLLPEDVDVMTLNMDSNKAEWQRPTRYIHQHYSGDMFSVKSGNTDALVTPGHKFVTYTRKGARKLKTLDKISRQDRIPASVDWTGAHDKYSDDELAFIGFYLAEGCCRKDARVSGSYEIHFAQIRGIKGGEKGNVRDKFVDVLDRLGVSYRHTDDGLRVYSQLWWLEMERLGIIKLAPEKRIPREILDLSPQKLSVLFDWMVLGDGSIRRGGQTQYYTTSKGMAGDVQELCMKIGKSANIRAKAQKVSTLKNGRVILPKHDLYSVNVNIKKYSHFYSTRTGSYIGTSTYSGMVHCVEVPNHVVYVRRNGTPMWCGNSLRGNALVLALFDEYDYINPACWQEVIRPMLSTTGGKAIFAGTPDGKKQLSSLYHRGQSDDPRDSDWSSYHFTTLDGGWVSQKEIDDMRADMDDQTFRQEIMAEEILASGAVYYAFSQANIKPAPPELKQGHLCAGMDFNIAPWMSATVFAVKGEDMHIVDDIIIPRGNTYQMVDEIRHRYGTRLVDIYPDPAGRHLSTSAVVGTSDFTILEKAGFKLHSRLSTTSIKNGINAVNSRLCSQTKQRHLFVDPSLRRRSDAHPPRTIDCLEQHAYKIGTSVPDSDIFGHLCDSLRYATEYLFPVRDSRNWAQ